MQKNYFLKTADNAELESKLIEAGLGQVQPVYGGEEGATQFIINDGISLAVIGHIYVPTGEVEIDEIYNIQIPVNVAIDGWHANLKANELTAEQEAILPLIPEPSNPVLKWAGE